MNPLLTMMYLLHIICCNSVFVVALQAVGMAFGIAMTMMRTYGNTDDQIYDRTYRLRHNKGQVRMDKFTYGCAALGGLGGAAGGLSSAGAVASGVQGASMGIGLAVLAHVLTKRKEK